MKKHLKRTAALLLSTLTFSAAALPAIAADDLAVAEAVRSYAETSTKESMQTALTAIKKMIDIDEKVYTNFDYYCYQEYYYMPDSSDPIVTDVWEFYWYDNTYDTRINAAITADGTLVRYYKYSYNYNRYNVPTLASISNDTAASSANAFLKKVNSSYDSFSLVKNSQSTYIYDDSFYFYYTYTANGYNYDRTGVQISVDKHTGEVLNYYADAFASNIEFEKPENLINKEAAIEAFKEKIGLDLVYRGYYDYESKVYNVFPVYENSNSGKYIGATDGNLLEEYYYSGYYGASMNESVAVSDVASAKGGDAGEVSFSDAELKALAEAQNFITSEQAKQAQLDFIGVSGVSADAFSHSNTSLNKNYVEEGKYSYSISMRNEDILRGVKTGTETQVSPDTVVYVYGTVDAKTGRVLSFDLSTAQDYGIMVYDEYGNYVYPSNEPKYTYEEAEKLVAEFINKAATAEYALTNGENAYGVQQNGYSYVFSYERYANGIPFKSNGITVYFNAVTGTVRAFYLNWNDNVVFPDITNVISEAEAVDKYMDFCGYDIVYRLTEYGKASLVYTVTEYSYALINPFTGEAVYYDGSPFEKYTYTTPDYSAVEGTWCENIVKTLADNGIWLGDGKFDPNQEMTVQEFISYVTQVVSNGNIYDKVSDEKITKAEAAKLLTEAIGYGKLASISQIFSYPYNDTVDPAYKGYIAICNAFGLLKADANGNFNASSVITKAEAAEIVYNLIVNYVEIVNVNY